MQDLRVCNEIIDITALRGYAFEFITFKISLFVKKFACNYLSESNPLKIMVELNPLKQRRFLANLVKHSW